MTEATIRTLSALEYDFIALDTGLGQLLERLADIDRPEAKLAAETLYLARLQTRRALDQIDAPLTEAVLLAETLPGAPF